MFIKITIKSQFWLCLIAFIFIFKSDVKTQDPIFSQFYNTTLQVNPAMTGNTFRPRLALNYRNQYPGFPNAYTTYTASYDQFIDRFNAGVGVYILTDNAADGTIINNKLSLNYAYSLKIKNDHYIKLGLEPSILQNTVNWDKLVFGTDISETGVITPGGTQINGVESRPEDLTKLTFDFGAGAVYFNKFFHVGISAKHLNSSNLQFTSTGKSESILGVPLKLAIQMGGQVNLKKFSTREEKSYWSPQLLFVSQGPFQQLNIGSQLKINNVLAGIWYRNLLNQSESVIFGVGFDFNNIKAMYSFDFPVSGFGRDVGGAHELSFMLLFGKEKRRPDYNDCFELFR